ncbi:hypothetical protein PYW08_005164 [Mythimna loreyi]|uniref:Uncharacterized protein n=1 Tax=Mythimna loreyi TaxID=667449 RepID=A0ACC2QEU7_9NEOP|nr:hypothetical protein PYW08_005164 [Mythimna loreyi]
MTESKIYYCKNTKGGPSAVIINRSEWDRLEKQASGPRKPSRQNEEYLKGLIEKSQAWMKTWPDTVQGYVELHKKKKEKQHADDVAAVKAFSKKKKLRKNNTEDIQKAKQKIFDRSCYGAKLISALVESKTIEEREAQIQFAKELKDKQIALERKAKTVKFCTFDLDKNETDMEDLQKCNTIQNAKENKAMYEKKKEDEAKAKEEDKLADLTDAQMMKYLFDLEQEAEDNMKLLEKQALEQYAIECKKTKEERTKWEAEYEAKIDKCHKEQEELNCKIRNVHLQLVKERTDLTGSRTFKTVKKCQEKEKKRYEDFIHKSCTKGEERAAKREQRAKDKTKQDRNNAITTADINKSMAEYVKQRECSNKCFCDRQCFITKSDKPHVIRKAHCEMEPEFKEPPPHFLSPCNRLVTDLRRREKLPSPWSGAEEMHLLFMTNANQTLGECKYKRPARKVVDEYRKHNALDETTLRIENYY